jgi:hypothetical protein
VLDSRARAADPVAEALMGAERSWAGFARRWLGASGAQARSSVDPADVRVVGHDESDAGALVLARWSSVAEAGRETWLALIATQTDLWVERLEADELVAGGSVVAKLVPAAVLVDFVNVNQTTHRPTSALTRRRLAGSPFPTTSNSCVVPVSLVFERPGLLIPAESALLLYSLAAGSVVDAFFAFREAA